MNPIHTKECFSQHMGLWLFEPLRFGQAISAVKAGTFRIRAMDGGEIMAEPPLTYALDDAGVAILPLHGTLGKAKGKYVDTSSIEVRRATRAAAADPAVKAMMVHVDSPGGQAMGTAEMADDFAAFNAVKPLYAHVEGIGASAAYWPISQARRITAESASEVGSIGIVAVVDDFSKAYEAKGVKTYVVSTGPYKGAFTEGAPILPDHLAYLQERVDAMNDLFIKDVASGRGMSQARVRESADGRVFGAEDAVKRGLIDEVASLDVAMGYARSKTRRSRRMIADAAIEAAEITGK